VHHNYNHHNRNYDNRNYHDGDDDNVV